jgi:Fic family protein
MDPFDLKPLPLTSISWEKHISELGNANRALANFDGKLSGIINQDILMSPLTTQEALISSQIEGVTQASFDDFLEYEADTKQKIDDKKKDEYLEVQNYRQALKNAVDILKLKPFNIDLILETHKILLSNVRGQTKDPGKIRTGQVWIGPGGTPIGKATYVPPAPEHVMPLLKNWEEYLRFQEKDPLVQIAILKAQFELIHPFRDGHGRIGRMLIPLFLYYKKIIKSPLFYVSSYFQEHQLQYYTRLQAISQEDDWDSWISFFLEGIYQQSGSNSDKATRIINLYNIMKVRIPELLKSKHNIQVIDFLFTKPKFSSTIFIEQTRIPKQSAIRIIDQLEERGIVHRIREAKGNVPDYYSFDELVTISR